MSTHPYDPTQRPLTTTLQDTEDRFERLGTLTIRALQALAAVRPTQARPLRAQAVEVTRGAFPALAKQLLHLPIPLDPPGMLRMTLTIEYDPAGGLTDDHVLREIERVLESADPEIHLTLTEP